MMDANGFGEPTASAVVPEQVPNGVEITADKPELEVILNYLKKHNLKGTEAALLAEAKNISGATSTSSPQTSQTKGLDSYKSTEAPSTFEGDYENYIKFIDDTLEVYKEELKLLIYPIFIHMYMNLVYNNHEHSAMAFFDTYEEKQDPCYTEYLEQLSNIRKKEHMETDPLVAVLRSNKFVVKMSRETLNHVKRHIQDHKMSTLQAIVNDQLHIETYDGPPRDKNQTTATSGSMVGETKKDVNKVKVYYGLLKEPDINIPIDDDDDAEDGDKPKKKKSRRDASAMKKSKNDPNAPNLTRIPLPELRDIDKQEKIQIYKDTRKRADLSSKSLPSICFYTLLNNFTGVSCATFTDDSSMLSAGFEDSSIKVWALSQQKLRSMKPGESLAELDKDSDDILERMMDDTTSSECKTLIGHSGPIYALSFSPDRQYLLSCSEDGTVRMWSLLTWTNIVCYKGHNYPVFDVQFSHHGFYFVSGGHDRLARLWSTDHFQPLRLLAGHFSDVDCVRFHPNTNYVATGSSDRIVRLFDVLNGNCVRTMTGHKGVVTSLCFSPCGRYLASGGADSNVHIWDLSNGTLVSCLSGHSDSIISISFSREGTILASGGMDNLVCLWDMTQLSEERTAPDINTQQHSQLVSIPILQSFPTKATPVMCLHFTRRNLLLAAGAFQYR